MPLKHPLAALAGLALFLTAPAYAAVDSAYTEIDLDECLLLEADDFGASWACPGYKGFPLYIAEGDLRFFVSYGFDALDEPARSQTLPPFNTIHSTLEWRLSNETGNWKPFATILRYFTESGVESEIKGEVLVVTKIERGNTCHIAYVDTKLLALPDANPNEIARSFADEYARDFDCETDEPHYYPS